MGIAQGAFQKGELKMRRVLPVLFISISIVTFFGIRSDSGTAQERAAFVPGEVIVFFTDRESTVVERTTDGKS
jgi:hypothetical protein